MLNRLGEKPNPGSRMLSYYKYTYIIFRTKGGADRRLHTTDLPTSFIHKCCLQGDLVEKHVTNYKNLNLQPVLNDVKSVIHQLPRNQ